MTTGSRSLEDVINQIASEGIGANDLRNAVRRVQKDYHQRIVLAITFGGGVLTTATAVLACLGLALALPVAKDFDTSLTVMIFIMAIAIGAWLIVAAMVVYAVQNGQI